MARSGIQARIQKQTQRGHRRDLGPDKARSTNLSGYAKRKMKARANAGPSRDDLLNVYEYTEDRPRVRGKHKGKQRREEGGSGGESEDETVLRLDGDRGGSEDEEEEGEGDSDDSIDSDEAFDESDEERFAHFVFRGSKNPNLQAQSKGTHAMTPVCPLFPWDPFDTLWLSDGK